MVARRTRDCDVGVNDVDDVASNRHVDWIGTAEHFKSNRAPLVGRTFSVACCDAVAAAARIGSVAGYAWQMTSPTDHRVVRLIAIFKLLKAAALVLLAAGAFEAARVGVLAQLLAWLGSLPLTEAHAGIHRLLTDAGDVTPRGAEVIGAVALLYSGLFAVEGFGLWFEKSWAEYLTVIATASLVPFELWALLEHATVLRAFALLVNILIVVFLVRLVRRPRTGTPAAHGAG